MFTTIFWKEYRQQLPMGIALFAIVVALQLLTTITVWFNGGSDSVPLLAIAIVLSALYSASSAAILFCNEHEEKTFSFLRSLPVSRGTVLAGKLAWVFCGSLAFLLVVLLESALLHLVCFGMDLYIQPDNWVEPMIWFPLGCIVFPICWGLFWTPLMRSQMNALLLSFASAAVTFWGSYQAVAYIFNEQGTRVESPWAATLLVAVFCGVTLLAGIIGVVTGYRWFDIWRDKGNRFADFRTISQETAETRTAQYVLARTAVKKRGEFLSLCVHAYRQQKTLFHAMIGMGLATWLGLLVVLLFGNMMPKQSGFWGEFVGLGVGLWWGILFVTLYVYCASVFAGDQKTKAAFLSERGIAPGKIWWSRVLTFATPYLSIALLFALTVFIAFVIHNGGLSSQTRYYSYGEERYYHLWQFLAGLGTYFVFVVMPLFVGIFVSMLLRSPILSIVATAGLNYALVIWGMLMYHYLGVWTSINGIDSNIPTLAWSAVPLFLVIVVASRLRTDDWLRGRTLWRSKRPVMLCIAATFAAICLAMPFYRVYTIPKIDYGYRADPLVLTANYKTKPLQSVALNEHVTIHETNWEWFRTSVEDVETLKQRWESVNAALTDPSRADVACAHLNLEDEVVWSLMERLPRRARQEATADDPVPERDPAILVAKIDPKFLDDALQLLHLLGTKRVPLTERLARLHEENYRAGLASNIVFTLLPWERQRYLREADYRFQYFSSMAEKAEKIVFHNQGDIVSWSEYHATERYTDELYARALLPVGMQWGHNSVNVWRVYSHERSRRTAILQFALLKYVQENGALPETLDALQTSGILAEIPTIPYTGLPFFYDPNPDGSEWPEDDRRNAYTWHQHKPGTPYLWADQLGGTSVKPYVDRRYNSGHWYDLKFEF